MRYAVIDTGSNTIRMSIYECSNGVYKEIFTEAIFADLASHIVDNRLTNDGMSACCQAISAHIKKASEYKIADFRVFATASIRNVTNSKEIAKSVKKNTGVDLEILSGKDEGELSFLGACGDFPVDNGVMADVGGGSSEIIVFHNKIPYKINSIPLGSLATYKRFVSQTIPTATEAEKIKTEIKNYLDGFKDFNDISTENLCLVGGGIRATKKISKVFLGTDNPNVYEINKLLDLFINTPDAINVLEQLAPKRKLTFTTGLAIYSAIGEYFGADKIYTSDKGIKEGYLIKYLIN